MAEQENLKLKAASENMVSLQGQLEQANAKLRLLEMQQLEARNFEIHMARVTASMENERELLEQQLKRVLNKDKDHAMMTTSSSSQQQSDAQLKKDDFNRLSQHCEQLEQQVTLLQKQIRYDTSQHEEGMRLMHDKIDAEHVLNDGLKKECDYLRGMMGTNIDELRVKMESGLQLALNRVDQMEQLLWQERGKSKKYMKLLTQLVEKEDLDVLLAEGDDEEK